MGMLLLVEYSSEEEKAKSRNMKNLAKKVVVDFIGKEAEKELTKLNQKPNNIFRLVTFVKKMEKIMKEEDALEEKTKS